MARTLQPRLITSTISSESAGEEPWGLSGRKSTPYGRVGLSTGELANWCSADASRYVRFMPQPAANLKRRGGAMSRCLASKPAVS
jgi:hypothetical protein